MTRSVKRFLIPVSAAALAGAVLPVSAGASAASTADPGFGGFSSVAVAAPVKLELYEPTIPIPADPQLEVEMAYTRVEADSGSSLGRASWLWPGDPVGEGAKTFGEQLGLPPQLFENGYPVQVNSSQPSGEESQADQPFPGTVMTTSASDTRTVAQAGFSPDGKVEDGSGKDRGDGDGGTPGVPGSPGLPELPGLSSATDVLQKFGQAITGGPTTAQQEGGPTPGLPPEVAALVDLEGYTSSSQNVVRDGHVSTISRAAVGDVSLLGGLITLDGIVSTSTSGSDGSKNTAAGRSVLGGMTVAGQEFSFGPGGYSAGPQQGEVPPIPDQATAALKQLGVTLTFPKPELRRKGDTASSSVAALRVEIDAGTLRKQLNALPIADLVDQLPDDPKELKSTLQAIAGLSPRVVITLGAATTKIETVDAIDLPTDVPDNDHGTSGGSTGGAAPGSTSSGGTPPSASAPGSAGAGDAPAAGGDLPPSQLTGAGLPPLYSIPGAILVGGIALAAVGGTWLRRIGMIALGGAGSCPHGLDSGLPDLRKA